MPKHDLFFIWAGDAPPEWGKEGYKNLQKNFGSHYDLHFMYEPRTIWYRDGKNQMRPGISKDWSDALAEAEKRGIDTMRVSTRVAELAGREMAAAGSSYDASWFAGYVRMHMENRNYSAVKDIAATGILSSGHKDFAEKMVYFDLGADVIPGAPQRRSDNAFLNSAINRVIGRRGIQADLHIKDHTGILLPNFVHRRISHVPGESSPHRFDHMQDGRVQAPHLDAFVMGSKGPRGRAFFAEVTANQLGYAHDVVQKDLDAGNIRLRANQPFALDAIDPNNSNFPTAHWLDHREHNDRRQQLIGGTIMHAIAEAYIKNYAPPAQSGYTPGNPLSYNVGPKTLADTTVPVNEAYTGPGQVSGASNWQVGGNLLHHSRNSWRGQVPDAEKQFVTAYDMTRTPDLSDPSIPSGAYPRPAPGQTTNSSPTRSLDEQMDGLTIGQRPYSYGDQPLDYAEGEFARTEPPNPYVSTASAMPYTVTPGPVYNFTPAPVVSGMSYGNYGSSSVATGDLPTTSPSRPTGSQSYSGYNTAAAAAATYPAATPTEQQEREQRPDNSSSKPPSRMKYVAEHKPGGRLK
ncbi:hypothetical protein [Micromonospora profundi]|uniref:hypothetical protein n=1 Tax=Micromonospora profundi TaxID=1420889 RepID=UPI003662D02F